MDQFPCKLSKVLPVRTDAVITYKLINMDLPPHELSNSSPLRARGCAPQRPDAHQKKNHIFSHQDIFNLGHIRIYPSRIMTVEVVSDSTISVRRGFIKKKSIKAILYLKKTAENSLTFSIDSDFGFSTNTKYSL